MILLNIFGSALGIFQVSLVFCLFAVTYIWRKDFPLETALNFSGESLQGFLWSVQHVRKSLDLWKTIFC